MTELKPCIVTWEDAWSTYSQVKIADFETYKPCMRRTIGFVLFKDESRIVVAGTDDRASVEQLEGTDIAEITTIPIGMVRNEQYLKPMFHKPQRVTTKKKR